jgi:hypothetical protein
MKRSLVVCGILGGAALAGASSTFARQNQPGMPTLAQVYILNRERGDAIPIKVQNTGDALPVIVSGLPPISLAQNTMVSSLSARQLWEYRRLAVPIASDSTPALSEAGLQGWEVVHGMTVGSNLVWTLKGPR